MKIIGLIILHIALLTKLLFTFVNEQGKRDPYMEIILLIRKCQLLHTVAGSNIDLSTFSQPLMMSLGQ